MGVISSWGEAIMASVAAALLPVFAAIPRLIGFAIIVVIGWVISTIVGKLLTSMLRSIKFNELAQRSGFASFVSGMGVKTDASEFLALVAQWFIRLLTLVVAFDALGLPAVSDVLRQLLLWLPNLVVGIVVLVIGGLVARAFGSLVRGSSAQAGLQQPELLGRVAEVAVWAFAIIIAVNQIGVAQTLVNTLFMAAVGAVALALGLAFGPGGRDVAARLVERWYDSAEEAAPRIENAAEAAATKPKSPRPPAKRTPTAS